MFGDLRDGNRFTGESAQVRRTGVKGVAEKSAGN